VIQSYSLCDNMWMHILLLIIREVPDLQVADIQVASERNRHCYAETAVGMILPGAPYSPWPQ
jgi:hypothetical protein